MLFDEFERADYSPKGARESSYEYLNRSSRKSDGFLRQTLEEWFEVYSVNNPKEAKKLRGHLISKEDDQHFSAFFELYLFTFLRNLGYEIEVEPSIANSTKNPDFLVSNPKTGKQFYLEATTVCEGEINVKREQQINLFIERLNKISFSRYAIELYWYGVCSEQDISKQIINEIRLWINNPLSSYKKEFLNWGFRLEAKKVDRPLEQKVTLRKLDKVQALSEKTRIEKDSIYENRMDGVERIHKALVGKKASKYGDQEKPHLIALNMIGQYFFVCGKRFLKDALFGRETVCINERGEHFCTRAQDGFWTKPTDNNSTNGVFGFFNLTPHRMFESVHNQDSLGSFPDFKYLAAVLGHIPDLAAAVSIAYVFL